MHWLALTRRNVAARRMQHQQASLLPTTAPRHGLVRTPERRASPMSAVSPEGKARSRPGVFSQPRSGKESAAAADSLDQEVNSITQRLRWFDSLRQQHRRDRHIAVELNAQISDASLRLSCGLGLGGDDVDVQAKAAELHEIELKMGRFQEMWRRHLPELQRLQARVAELQAATPTSLVDP